MKKIYLSIFSIGIRVLGFWIVILGVLFQIMYRKTRIQKFRKISMMFYTRHYALVHYRRFIYSGFTPDDVMICSFPRSGTNWISMIVYHLLKKGNIKELDNLMDAFLHLESCSNSELNNLTPPKIIYSHLPFKFIYRKRLRYIYCLRDGKDVSVSYYRFYNDYYLHESDAPYSKFHGFFDLFCQDFFGEISLSTSWFKHTSAWLNHKENKNILFVKYEDIKENPVLIISQIASFLKLSVTPERIEEIIDNCSFNSMKRKSHLFDDNKREVNYNAYARKGIVGDWENHLTGKQKSVFDREIEKYPELLKMYPVHQDS